MIDPRLDHEIRYRQGRVRDQMAAEPIHARLKAAFHSAVERFRASGREDDHQRLLGRLAELERFEEGQKKAPDQGQLVEG